MKSIRFLSLLLLLNLFAAGGYVADQPVKKRDCRKWCGDRYAETTCYRCCCDRWR